MASALMLMPFNAFAAETTNSTDADAIVSADSTVQEEEGNSNITVESVGWPKYICTGDNVNVRSGPGTSYDSVGKLMKGTVVRVRSTSDGWAKIKFGSGIGYVYAKYLKKQ